MREINFKKLSDQVRNRFYKNKLNLDIAEKGHKQSYFNLKNKYVRIEVLTPNNNFDFKGLFYEVIQNKIYFLVHISDNTVSNTRSLPPVWLMNMKLPFSSIQNCDSSPISILDDSEINVFVYNDNGSVVCSDVKEIITNIKKFSLDEKIKDEDDPNEAGGGGVIVKGP